MKETIEILEKSNFKDGEQLSTNFSIQINTLE